MLSGISRKRDGKHINGRTCAKVTGYLVARIGVRARHRDAAAGCMRAPVSGSSVAHQGPLVSHGEELAPEVIELVVVGALMVKSGLG